MIRTDGLVKVLDFGLAMWGEAQAIEAGGKTLVPLMQQGAILGTFQYMTPERFEWGETDARTDIFALGCVLCEMATGWRAFAGKSRADLKSGSPPWCFYPQKANGARMDRRATVTTRRSTTALGGPR